MLDLLRMCGERLLTVAPLDLTLNSVRTGNIGSTITARSASHIRRLGTGHP